MTYTTAGMLMLLPLLLYEADSFLPLTSSTVNLNRLRPIHSPTEKKSFVLFGGGFGKPTSVNDNKRRSKNKKKISSSSSSSLSNKKKLQIQERTLSSYGGDIAQGTQERIAKAVSSLPQHEQSIAELYRKVTQWDAYASSLSPEKHQKIRPQDAQRAQDNRSELYRELDRHGLTEFDAHNIMQKITWDASADAKATKALIGSMPSHIQERVDRACREIAEAVKQTTLGKRKGRCLDVGCGHGTLVPTFDKFGLSPAQIVGVDLSPEMVRNARERYRGVTFVAVDFLSGDGEWDVQDKEDGFDGIIFCSSLHDFPDMGAALVKAAGLLRPQGKLVILHAQGGKHVLGQYKSNPVMVKRGLPTTEELEITVSSLGLELMHAPAEPGSSLDDEEGYLAILRRPL